MNKNSPSLAHSIILSAIITLMIAPLHAQSAGKIIGEVKDEDGNPLIGANVIVQDTYLGAATNVDGYFYILNVPVGTYAITVSMIGYTSVTVVDVLVALDRTSTLQIAMETESIEYDMIVVTAQRDVLHKEVSNSQQIVTAEQLEEAPGVQTLNHYLGTMAGVTEERDLTVRGGSAEQTGALVNGMSFTNPRIGKAEASIPFSAVEQISLQTGGFSAEYGNFRSALVNVTTKSGDHDAYHGSFQFSRNIPHMKRFGKSLYDPMNEGLRPYTDPVVGFMGTNTGWLVVTGGDTAEADVLKANHVSFTGWETKAPGYNRGKPVEEQATAMDLYLFSAWMHQTVPDFAALDTLYPQYDITDEQKQALRDHAHTPEGENEDYNIDFGFGGPVPIIGEWLGDATFHLSNKTTNFNYVQPVMRDAESTSITMLTVKSNLSKSMTLTLNGLYRKISGSQTTFPTDGTIPDLDGGGDTMPIDNLDVFVDEVPDEPTDMYYWHPTFWQPKDQITMLGGLTLNKLVSPSTYWILTFSYARHSDEFKPKTTRDRTPIINFGPIWVNEMPYGVTFTPDTIRYDPGNPDLYYAHDEYEAPYSLTRRFSSKVGQYHENSLTQQLHGRFEFSSQVNLSNLVKTGIELNFYDIKNDNWRWWQGHDTIYEMRDRRKPWQLGGFLQDQITLEGLEARIGLRVDYYNSGGGVWPTGDPFNMDAFTKGTEAESVAQLREDLESGKQVVWARWRAIDDSLGGTFLEKTKNFLTVSPRIGMAFPISDRSKFYFNYGHFRQPTPYSEQFMYKMRFYKQGLFNLGNPNLEPPRTISYELGVAYNLGDKYLIDASTYYKDVTGESAIIRYLNSDGTISYDSWLNNRWENDQGFELKITKTIGPVLTGWLNFWYVIDRNGRAGRRTAYEDPVRNAESGALYAGDENSPTARDENRPGLIPRFAANISLHTPRKFGPQIMGVDWLGGWNISILPTWRRGSLFTYNPAGSRNVTDNLRWPDYVMTDFKMSKTFKVGKVSANFYVDIKNLFNLKVSQWDDEWAFADETDRDEYFKSLHLDIYDSPDYDDLREKNPGKYIVGNDTVGDLRSDKKDYINDPNYKMFLYGQPRDTWFGLKFNF
ncbi:carboxypeptidase-like regulatory domain-containing protein [Candidatus Neomarinimicrobiota bacterium]